MCDAIGSFFDQVRAKIRLHERRECEDLIETGLAESASRVECLARSSCKKRPRRRIPLAHRSPLEC